MKRLRKLLLAVVAALLGTAWAALAVYWLLPDVTHQYKVLATGAAALLTILLGSIWVLFLSRLRWRARLVTLALAAATVSAAGLTLQIGGVTGDLVPILAWRWTPSSPAKESTGASVSAPEAGTRAENAVALLGMEPLDYPRFLGPAGDATVHGVRLARDWRARPPRLLWRRPLGAGWSSFAIQAGHAVTQEQRGEEEVVACYDLRTGQLEWQHADAARFNATIGGEGPRATPTIAGGRVYAMGATGILNCLEGATGRAIWSHDVVAENGSRVNEWGKSCSPLVLGNRVIVSAGGADGRSLVAYHAETGERAWSGGSSRSGYGSPLVATLAGVPQILIFNNSTVTAHDPTDGRVLWEHTWQRDHPNVTQPVPIEGSKVLIASGYGVGCELFEVHKDADGRLSTAPVWRERSLKSKFANIVVRGGFAFGLDDGILACVNLADGHRAWKGGRYGHGQLLLVEDLILVQAESGEVVLVEAASGAHRELGRFPALEDKTWNHPAFRPPFLLVRNHKEAACYELPLEE